MALFVALAGTATWGAVRMAPSSTAPTATKPSGTGPGSTSMAYHEVPGMVVTYEAGFDGGPVDDGKGTTTYKEPYDPTVFVAAIVNGRPEQGRYGGYYGWTVTVPATCAVRAKAAVGRRMPIAVRPSENDDSNQSLDIARTRAAICTGQ